MRGATTQCTVPPSSAVATTGTRSTRSSSENSTTNSGGRDEIEIRRATGPVPHIMTIVGLDHVQLAMPQGGEDDADAFYRDLLGFSVVPKPPLLAARGGRWYQAGAVHVHLGVEANFRAATKAHPALVADD